MDLTDSARLVYSPHPLLAAADRRIITEPFLPYETIAAYLERMGIHLEGQPAALTLDGVPMARHTWATTALHPGAIINIRALVKDGGGGGSNPVRTLLTIAVLAAAPYAGAYAGIMAGSQLGYAAGYAAAVYGGMMVVNSLVPPPMADLSRAAGTNDNPSPTYSITGGGNRARLHEPLPLVFGRHRVFPDLGAQPYTEFEGEDQYLYQVFNFGLTPFLRLSEFRIGDTLLTDFDGVEVYVSGDTGAVPGFPGNVDTLNVAAQLTEDAGWLQRTSSADATSLSVDLVGSLFYAGDKRVQSRSATFEVEYRKVGDTTWLPAVYSDVAHQYTHYWSAGRWEIDDGGSDYWLQVAHDGTDAGLHFDGEPYGTDLTWRFRPYTELLYYPCEDDPAPPQTYYVQVAQAIITNATRKPVRRTYTWEVIRGQYEVRVRRVTPDETDDRAVSDISWSALRTYQPDDADYSGQTRVGLKIKASGQLNGVIDQFNAMSEAWVPVWGGANWATKPTSNPAWLFLWFARGEFDANGQRLFGAGLPDGRIDIVAIQEWAAWCDANGLTCNLVLDRAMNCRDVLAAIASCGLGAPTWASGTLGVVWDAADQPIVATFGMSNIRRGSFRVEYATGDLADEIVATFINPDLGWKPDTVRVTVPGVTTPTRPQRVELWGCTDKAEAGKKANLLAARQAYHRRRVTWETDAEGLVVTRGDVVLLSHDLTQWGYSGRLVAGSTLTLTLSESVPFTPGETHYLGLREPDGTFTIHEVDYQLGESDTVTITVPLPMAPDDGRPVDWLWFFAPLPTPGKKVKIIDVRPLSEHHVRITAIDEEPAYYAAAGGTYTYVPPVTLLRPATVEHLQASEDVLNYNDGIVRVHLTWELIGADKARLRIGVNGGDLQDYGEVSGGQRDLEFREGDQLVIEVSPIVVASVGVSGKATLSHTVGQYTLDTIPPLPPPSNVSGLELDGLGADIGQGNATEFTGRDAKFRWRRTATQRYYELGQEPYGGDSGTLDASFDGYVVRMSHGGELVRTDYTRDNLYTYSYEKNAEDGLAREFTIEVTARDIYDRESPRPARLTVSNPAPGLPTGINLRAGFRTLFLSFTEPDDLDYRGVMVWVGTAPGFARNAASLVHQGPGNAVVIDALGDGSPLTAGTTYYVVLQAYDAFGLEGTQSVALSATTLKVTGQYDIESQSIQQAQLGLAIIEDAQVGNLTVDAIQSGSWSGKYIDLVSGGFIAGGQVGWDNGVGFWLGDEAGTAKFSIGDSAGNKLTWNGSALNVTGNITGSTITGGIIQTATSGKRVVISGADDEALFYDTDGSLLGDIGTHAFDSDNTFMRIVAKGKRGIHVDAGTLTVAAQVLINDYESKGWVAGTGSGKPTLPNVYGLRLLARSTTGSGYTYGIMAESDGTSIYGYSAGGTGVDGYSTSGTAVRGYVDALSSGNGGYFYGGVGGYGVYIGSLGKGPLRLGVDTALSAPTHSAMCGTLWVNGNGVMYINTSFDLGNPVEGTTWQKVGAQ